MTKQSVYIKRLPPRETGAVFISDLPAGDHRDLFRLWDEIMEPPIAKLNWVTYAMMIKAFAAYECIEAEAHATKKTPEEVIRDLYTYINSVAWTRGKTEKSKWVIEIGYILTIEKLRKVMTSSNVWWARRNGQ